MTVHVPGGIESEFNFPMFMYSKVWYASLICLSVLKYMLHFGACLFTLIVNEFQINTAAFWIYLALIGLWVAFVGMEHPVRSRHFLRFWQKV